MNPGRYWRAPIAAWLAFALTACAHAAEPLAEASSQPPLDDSRAVVVAYGSGGMGGMWHAYFDRLSDPRREVLVVLRLGAAQQVHRGTLTAQGFIEAVGLNQSVVAAEPLERSYGCPGCLDAPIATFHVKVPEGERMHSVDSVQPKGPVVLQRATAWLNLVASGVERCQSNELVSVDAECTGPFERAPSLPGQ